MADKKYVYSGPTSGVTLRIGEGKASKSREVMLFDGKAVELPPEHPYVKRLTARGQLTEPKTQPKASPPPNVSSNAGKGGSKELVS
jgi:hypothetical protein